MAPHTSQVKNVEIKNTYLILSDHQDYDSPEQYQFELHEFCGDQQIREEWKGKLNKFYKKETLFS